MDLMWPARSPWNWLARLTRGHGTRPVRKRLGLEILEDRLAPAVTVLPPVDEDSARPAPATVGAILGTSFSDVDGDGGGLAVVAATGSGVWQFSLDDRTWTSMANLEPARALLLDESDQIRFVPAADWNGVAELTFHGWDRSAGLAGERADASTTGGATPFSEATGSATVSVTPSNDRPVLRTAATPVLPSLPAGAANPAGALVSSLLGGASDPDGDALGVALTALGAGGAWQFSLDGVSWNSTGAVSARNALLLPPTARLRLLPAEDFRGVTTFAFKAWDQTSGPGPRANTTDPAVKAFSTESETGFVSVGNQAPVLKPGSPVLPGGVEDSPAAFRVA